MWLVDALAGPGCPKGCGFYTACSLTGLNLRNFAARDPRARLYNKDRVVFKEEYECPVVDNIQCKIPNLYLNDDFCDCPGCEDEDSHTCDDCGTDLPNASQVLVNADQLVTCPETCPDIFGNELDQGQDLSVFPLRLPCVGGGQTLPPGEVFTCPGPNGCQILAAAQDDGFCDTWFSCSKLLLCPKNIRILSCFVFALHKTSVTKDCFFLISAKQMCIRIVQNLALMNKTSRAALVDVHSVAIGRQANAPCFAARSLPVPLAFNAPFQCTKSTKTFVIVKTAQMSRCGIVKHASAQEVAAPSLNIATFSVTHLATLSAVMAAPYQEFISMTFNATVLIAPMRYSLLVKLVHLDAQQLVSLLLTITASMEAMIHKGTMEVMEAMVMEVEMPVLRGGCFDNDPFTVRTFRCEDGCEIDRNLKNDFICDCSNCEDEDRLNCSTCAEGCPSTCGAFTLCNFTFTCPDGCIIPASFQNDGICDCPGTCADEPDDFTCSTCICPSLCREFLGGASDVEDLGANFTFAWLSRGTLSFRQLPRQLRSLPDTESNTPSLSPWKPWKGPWSSWTRREAGRSTGIGAITTSHDEPILKLLLTYPSILHISSM